MIQKLLLPSIIIMLIAFIIKLNTLPPQIPLFYSLPWGESQLAETWMIFFIPLLMLLFIFLNNFIEKKLFFENDFIKKIFYYLNILIIISFTFIFLKIILLVS